MTLEARPEQALRYIIQEMRRGPGTVVFGECGLGENQPARAIGAWRDASMGAHGAARVASSPAVFGPHVGGAGLMRVPGCRRRHAHVPLTRHETHPSRLMRIAPRIVPLPASPAALGAGASGHHPPFQVNAIRWIILPTRSGSGARRGRRPAPGSSPATSPSPPSSPARRSRRTRRGRRAPLPRWGR